MKRFIAVLLAGLLTFSGCGDHFSRNSRPGAVVTTIPQPGNSQPFDIFIYNGTQFPIVITFTPGQAIIIPVGGTVDLPIGFLPASVTIDAYLLRTPIYYLPTQTKVYNIDYSPWATYVSFSFY